MNLSQMQEFALSYTRAWSSQKPISVHTKNGSLQINRNDPSSGRDELEATAKSCMTEVPDMVLSMDDPGFDGE